MTEKRIIYLGSALAVNVVLIFVSVGTYDILVARGLDPQLVRGWVMVSHALFLLVSVAIAALLSRSEKR